MILILNFFNIKFWIDMKDLDIEVINEKLNEIHVDPTDRHKIVSMFSWPKRDFNDEYHERFSFDQEMQTNVLITEKVDSSLVKWYYPMKIKDFELLENNRLRYFLI